MRFLAIHLPAFRLERCGYQAHEVAGLLAEVKNAVRLVALTPGARAQGLARGMTASAARALVPEVELEPLDAAGEHEDRCALVRAVRALSDRVAFPWEDDLVLEVSGVAHLYGGEQGLVERARQLLTTLGHRVRLVLADEPLAAVALARHHEEDRVVAPGGAAEWLAPLPLAVLRPSAWLVDALRAVGVERLGQLARLDPASIAGRLGAEGIRLHRIARGEATAGTEVGWGEHDGEHLSVRVRLGGATSTLQIHFALPGLLATLAERLMAQDLAVVRLQVVLRLEDGWGDDDARSRGRVGVAVRVGRPTRNPRILESLVRQRLEGLKLTAPVDLLELQALEVTPDIGWQPGLTDRTEQSEPLPDLLARLADHLGPEACLAAELVDAWRPECAWKPRAWPPRTPQERSFMRDPRAIPAVVDTSEDPVERQQAWEDALPRPRPTQLLDAPTPLQVEVEDGRPVAVHLGLRGWVPVRRVAGPERLEGEWWAAERRFSRDYWVVEADDRTAWIFRDRTRERWILHGWF